MNPPAGSTFSSNSNTAAATNSNQAGGMVPYNGAQNLDPNAFNATGANLKVVPYQPKKDEMPYGTHNAPDDSTVTVGSRGKEFVETRTFKNHEALAKVEKIMDGTDTKYKVFLKNGRVLEAPAEKLANFKAMAPNSILDAVGMLPKPETSAPAKNEQKEAQKP
jgi:hypothetical protein